MPRSTPMLGPEAPPGPRPRAPEQKGRPVLVDRSIPFIDTHHHLWQLERFRYDWLSGNRDSVLGDCAALRVDYTVDDLLADFAGSNVVKSIHVEADYSGPDPVEETRWLQSIADRQGFPHAIVVYCDLERDGADAELARHVESPNLRGIRIRSHPEDPDVGPFQRNYAALERFNLSYELNATPDKLRSGRDVAIAHPGIQVILGHTGMPLERSAEYFRTWRAAMRNLAGAQNVAVKISGLGMIQHRWTVDSIRPWVLETIELFGADRCMFGTNFPVDKLYSSYQMLVDAYREIIAGFGREEQEKLLYRNAEKFYRI